MIALTIKSTKSIMGALLATQAFDDFDVEEITISTFNTFSIDGHINKDFFSGEEIGNMPDGLPVFSSWKEIKPVCFSLIKGKKTPVSFKFILHASKKLVEDLCNEENVTITKDLVKGLVINVKYDDGKLVIVTGSSYNTFVMDKSLDLAWDKYLPKFLNEINIEFDEI